MEFASLGLSALAVAVAIFVPWRIAYKQNKIALLEKRVDNYIRLSSYLKKSFLTGIAISNSFSEQQGNGAAFRRCSPWDERSMEERELFTETSFLFSKNIQKIVKRIVANRQRIYYIDQLLEEGIARFSEEDLKKYCHFDEERCLYGEIESVCSELKRISYKYRFIHKEAIDELHIEKSNCDVFSLEKEQENLVQETRELQKVLLDTLEKEILIKE